MSSKKSDQDVVDEDYRGRQMILREFLAKLEKTKNCFDWQLSGCPQFPDDRRGQPRTRIRARSKLDPELFFDPIGAACYDLTGERFGEDAWMEAAKAIELSLVDAADVIAATNDRVWKSTGEIRQPDEYLQNLRVLLAKTVGLK